MNSRTMTNTRESGACPAQAHGLRSPAGREVSKLLKGLFLALALAVPHQYVLAMSVDLGAASGFAVLAGSGIAFAAGTTTIKGDIGSYSTATMSGMANLILDGVNHAGDATTQAAKSDLLAAYGDAAGRVPTTLYGAVFDLGGLTLNPGVYNGTTSLAITGALTLDAGGNPDAVWIIQAGSTLITASGSRVVLTGGAQAKNVIWQVGSSATLDTSSYFAGTILALTSITLNSGATMEGQALALNGAVSFDNNTLTVPEPGALHLLGLGLAVLAVLRPRVFAGKAVDFEERAL